MSTLNLSFGRVEVERVEAPEAWITAYELTGPRIRGTVLVVPKYNEPVTVWHTGRTNETAWEFRPSALRVAYGKAPRYSRDESGTLHVNSQELSGGVVVNETVPESKHFSVRRMDNSIDDSPAPAGTKARTRELIRALVELHRQDEALVRKTADAYAEHRKPARLKAVEKEYAEVQEHLLELKARAAELSTRRELLTGQAPPAAGTWVLGPAVPAFGALTA
ncbi:hypothetical protein J7E99_28245 [Streptomyces sp. ISL-44]|uniref:hypothetical protein n=1 Tax=Streptomyces sp. ISL-44 TaxID=2819184 RepID=UPI001BEBFB7E|nr:hypothetical protein [Streptomyces sp. ISL-44]MBT2544484.1 hypothetical protein [Streptomyces sp. ISL-44]